MTAWTACTTSTKEIEPGAGSPQRSAAAALFARIKTPLSCGALVAASAFMIGAATPAQAVGPSSDAFLVAKRSVAAPKGSVGLCTNYRWACARTGSRGVSNEAALRLAKAVNNRVNRTTREIEDLAQYGREEHWALPTATGGDCEDFALLKKKKLIESGVASETLLMATVLDRDLRSHAVLVMRTDDGDLVLDNLSNRILPWKRTGYTFLRMQNPSSPRRWDAIIAGGVARH